MTALIVVTYVFVALVLARPLAGDWAWRMYEAGKEDFPIMRRSQVRPYTNQWLGASVMAVAVTLVWPLLTVGALAWRLGGMRPIGRERDAKVREREERVAALEKELNL